MIRIVFALALLLLAARGAVAQPTPVSPFPRGLSGTLAFQSDKVTLTNPNGRARLFTIDLASGLVAPLGTGGDWDDEQPRWSPDGRRVAFKSNRGGSYNLYVMNADGSNVVRLTDHGLNDHDPTWLPDGESLVFSSERDRGRGRLDLYRLWLVDGSVERLTSSFPGMRSCRPYRLTARGSRSWRRRFLSMGSLRIRSTCSISRRGKRGRST